MPQIVHPERRTYYTAKSVDGSILHTGYTEVGQVTTSGQPVFETATEEHDYLELLADQTDKFDPLPEEGSRLQAGELYTWNDQVIIVRQDHIRMHFPPNETPALFLIRNQTEDWVVGESVGIGTRRLFEGVWYEAIQAHVTQEDWTPPSVPALWKVAEIEDPDPDPGVIEWAPGQTVAIGDLRSYEGTVYRCIQAHTTLAGWQPPNVPALWGVHNE